MSVGVANTCSPVDVYVATSIALVINAMPLTASVELYVTPNNNSSKILSTVSFALEISSKRFSSSSLAIKRRCQRQALIERATTTSCSFGFKLINAHEERIAL